VELTRFVSAFGTSEAAFANLMLYGILNAACEGGSENPLVLRVSHLIQPIRARTRRPDGSQADELNQLIESER